MGTRRSRFRCSTSSCGATDPFGVSFLSELADSPPPPPDPSAMDLNAILEAARSGQDPASIMGMMMGVDPGTQDAVFFTYSPNALAWQMGLPAPGIGNLGRYNFGHPIEHDGLGGWQPNAAAGVVIRLVDTPPDSVKAGRTYTAVAEPEGAGTLYSRWIGTTQLNQCPSRTGQPVLSGRTENVEFEQLHGSVSVTGTGAGVFRRPQGPSKSQGRSRRQRG